MLSSRLFPTDSWNAFLADSRSTVVEQMLALHKDLIPASTELYAWSELDSNTHRVGHAGRGGKSDTPPSCLFTAAAEPGMNIFVNRTPEELERKRQQKGAGRGANPGGKGGKGGKGAARAVSPEGVWGYNLVPWYFCVN